MKVAAIIVGIDGWEKYTLPLIDSIQEHEPKCHINVVDNASSEPYPRINIGGEKDDPHLRIGMHRTQRLCYSAAINYGKTHFLDMFREGYDWYIVLSNDVLCTGPFVDRLAEYGHEVAGPLVKQAHGFDYVEGWCVCVPGVVWEIVGGWDERFLGSDYEDVAFSTMARMHGVPLVEDKALPFVHLDQRQRYGITDFAANNAHNQALFLREYAGAVQA